MKPITKITLLAAITFYFLLSTFNCFAQLDTIHWLPPLHAGLNNQITDHYVYISTPITTPFTVTIKDGSGTILATPTVSNASPFTYFVGTGQTSGSPLFIPRASLNTVLAVSGLILSAPQPFYANIRVRSTNQADWATSKGTAGLGTTFRYGGFPQFNFGPPVGLGSSSNRNFVMGIMATQNNTTITVSGYNPAITFDGVPTIPAPPSFTITLNEGETYVVAGGTNFAPNRNGFVGALVQADKPIALNNGNMNGTIHPTNTSNQDIGIDLSIPIERLGKAYILVEGNGNPVMESPIVIAHFNNTNVFINGSATPITTLNAGQFFMVPNTNYQGVNHRNMFIRTSQPAYVYQALAATTSPADNDGGLVLVPPFNCFLPDSIDLIPAIDSIGVTPYSSALLITTELGATVQVNGVPLIGAEPVLGAPWQTYKTTTFTGNVKINSTAGVTVSVLGVASPAGCAGYFSGFSTIPLASDFTFTDTCFSNLTSFNANFDTQFNPDSIAWNFGDPASGLNNVATGTTTSHVFTSSGVYTVQMVVYRCQNDTITKTVTIGNCSLFTSFIPNNLIICQGETITFTDNSTSSSGITAWNWTFNGGTPSSAATQGPHTVTFTNPGTFAINLQITDANGIDDTTISITVNPTGTGTDLQTACNSLTWIDGVTYTSSTTTPTFTFVGGAANGCDSVVTLNLTINSFASGTDVIVSCSPITWINGNTYSASTNTPIFTIVGGATNGCDSLVTLNLTINSAATTTDVQTACSSLTWIDGVTYTSSTNIPTFTIVGGAANGCDSVVTLNLTINSAATGTDVITSCTPITWIDGNNYSASTTTPTFTIVGGSVNGCDSVVSLNLTITTPTSTTNVYNECNGFSVTIGLNTYTTTGVYTDIINNCDTIVTDLTINPTPELILIKVDDNCGQNSGSVTAITSTTNPPIIYSWNIGSSDSIINNLPFGTYSLIIADASGCTNTAQIVVDETQIDCDFFVYLPNVFTPNGDGNNDVFFVNGKGIVELNVKIYNRWGNKVFEINNINESWDGNYKGSEQNTAVFVYVLEATFLNGKTVIESGNVSLIR